MIGALFRSTDYQKNETDLVILVTPHIVKPLTPTDPIHTPLDGSLPPNDVDLFLMGQTEVSPELARLAAGDSVTAALYDAGFNSSGRFYTAAPAMLGMTPSAFKQGGKGEAIRYAVARCGLGFVLVAVAQRGICAILLGDAPDDLAADLAARFPKATMAPAGPDFAGLVARVVRLIDAPECAPDTKLPLDIRGTAFQRRVWQALQEIPAGETASYAVIARKIGKPSAVRAVAGACAANRLAVAIPCHRAIAADGSLSGYRWGIERKRRLLARERATKK